VSSNGFPFGEDFGIQLGALGRGECTEQRREDVLVEADQLPGGEYLVVLGDSPID
jgi:hypothetical protein